MKISIAAPYKEYNYGTVLQAYALQKVLADKGVGSEYVQYVEPQLHGWERLRTIACNLTKAFLARLKPKRAENLDDYSFLYGEDFREFREGFDDFVRRNIKESAPMSPEAMRSCREYDAYMVGSDQTWCEFRTRLNHLHLLEYANPAFPRLAYAPSVGTTHVGQQHLRTLVKALREFQSLSCRERANCRTLSEALGRNVECVVDPTLLIDADGWNGIAKPTGLPSKGYVLAYILGEKQCISDFAERLAEMYGVPVCYIVTRPVYASKAHHIFATPEMFLSLVRDARCVVTDSFHGSIFSINFGTQFYSFTKRGDKGVAVDNDRIVEVLSEFGLTSRFRNDGDTSFERDIDYSNPHDVLDGLRRHSLSYLYDAVGLPL